MTELGEQNPSTKRLFLLGSMYKDIVFYLMMFFQIMWVLCLLSAEQSCGIVYSKAKTWHLNVVSIILFQIRRGLWECIPPPRTTYVWLPKILVVLTVIFNTLKRHQLNTGVTGTFQTHQIVWSGVQCFVTSLYYGWGGCTCGTRSHQIRPGSLRRPAWGGLQWPAPPAPPASGTGSFYPPPPPASAF